MTMTWTGCRSVSVRRPGGQAPHLPAWHTNVTECLPHGDEWLDYVRSVQVPAMSSLPDPVTELHAIAEEFNGVDRVTDRVLGDLPSTQLPSAMNLLHYLVLRSHDLRDTQRALATDGLSS